MLMSLAKDLAELKEAMKGESKSMQEDARRRAIVEAAVRSADRIIMDFSDGSCEETDFLTGEVAAAFMHKVTLALQFKLMRQELRRTTKPINYALAGGRDDGTA